jgi:DNA-binding response OmpR family regulator
MAAVGAVSSDPKRDAHISICVCTPDGPLLESICDYLDKVGFGCLPAADGSAALRLCRYVRVDVLILDLAFTEGTVPDLLERISEPDFPEVGGVLVLSDRESGGTDVAALREGQWRSPIDDHLVEPFSFDELQGRVRRIMRRRHSRDADDFRLGELFIDPPRRKVTVGGREVHLARKEFTLLRVLATDPTRIFSKDELLRAVWGNRFPEGGSRTLDSHASRLRRKLDPEHTRFIDNSWGIGYRLVASVEDAGPVPAEGGEGR